MTTITATKFKARVAGILKEVAATGEPVVVTRRGKPLVRVERFEAKSRPFVLGKLRDSMKILGDIVAPVFDEWESVEPRKKSKDRRRR